MITLITFSHHYFPRFNNFSRSFNTSYAYLVHVAVYNTGILYLPYHQHRHTYIVYSDMGIRIHVIASSVISVLLYYYIVPTRCARVHGRRSMYMYSDAVYIINNISPSRPIFYCVFQSISKDTAIIKIL